MPALKPVGRLLIDADPIVYRAGFASEKTGYQLVVENDKGALEELVFWPKLVDDKSVSAGDQMKAYLAEHPGLEVLHKERLVDPEPLSHCLHIVGQELRSIIAECGRKRPLHPDKGVTVVLSGPGNYREKLATLKPYKGNRDAAHKPYHYQAIRDYLTGEWGAKVIHGREADDEVSIRAWEAWRSGKKKRCVVATIDKDLDQVPGLHYDYRQHVFYEVSEELAEQTFWIQTLAGDATDNIGGCHKVGTGIATKLVTAWYNDNMTPAQMWEEVVNMYDDSRKLPGCTYQDKNPHDVALETARLVYMQRAEGELWNPPGVPFGTVTAGVDD